MCLSEGVRFIWERELPPRVNCDLMDIMPLNARREGELLWLQAHQIPKRMGANEVSLIESCIQSYFGALIDGQQVEALVASMSCYRFATGERVCHQGAHGDVAFLVEEGSLHVGSNHLSLGIVGRGQLTASHALNGTSVSIRQYTLVALEPSVLWGLDRGCVHAVLAASDSRRDELAHIASFLNACQHFDVFSLEEKEVIVGGSYIKHGGSNMLLEGEFFPKRWEACFIMSGEVSVDGGLELVAGSFNPFLSSLFGPEPCQRLPCSLARKRAGDTLRIEFERLGPLANKVACQLSHLERRGMHLLDLQVVSHLSSGTFGDVSLVKDSRCNAKYALKKIPKSGMPEISKRVAQECDTLSQVQHPFVVQLVGTIETQDDVCIVTEFLSGGDLFDLMRSRSSTFSRREVQFYGGSLVLALEAIHILNIVHRDVKPENVMIDASGYVRLIDVGISKQLSGSERTFTVIGTCQYMAPEVYSKRGYDSTIDLWSLGIILYELMCGRLPFGISGNMDPLELARTVRKGAKSGVNFPTGYHDSVGQALLQALLQRSPEDRLGSGNNGYKDLKSHEYFQLPQHECLFRRLSEWEMAPPVKPASLAEKEETISVHEATAITICDACSRL